MSDRIKELDYLKCVFIVLMIVFHLAYFGDMYPYAKSIVYTFHMPAFLIISGYLANITKSHRQFCRSILWIVVPYAVMEIGYVCMSAFLPVRERVEELSVFLVFNKVFVAPMGPYWYLHTLIVCSVCYYVTYRLCTKLNGLSRFIILGLCLFALSHFLKLLSFSNAVYFMIGIAIRQGNLRFTQLFQPSAVSIIPWIILCCFPENLDRSTFAGIAITYLSISFLLYLNRFIPPKVERLLEHIGQHTLIILLFSPIFTILSKVAIPYLQFDHTGLLFMCLATAFTLAGCFAVAWVMDKLKLSKYFVGKTKMV
jgi:fucose 4-O-acetylase-like acetyltransferase